MARRPKILLVDDEDHVRLLLQVTLGLDQFDILHAATGKEALRIVRQTQPDLVLLDLKMPDIDGFAVFRALREEEATADVKVVLLTGFAGEQEQSHAAALGVDGYLTKPFSPLQLLDLVHHLLGFSVGDFAADS